jgi:hypothetical protein
MSKTNWNFALVLRNGSTKGKRPSTVLAEAARHVVGGMMCYLLSEAPIGYTRRTKTTRLVRDVDLVATWNELPSKAEIKRIKASIPVIA